MRTEDASEEFMLSRGGLSEETKKDYRKHLKLFQESFVELPAVPQPVQAWFNNFHNLRLAESTVYSIYTTIRALYKQMHGWHQEIPDPMPLVRVSKPKVKPMRIFTTDELYRLFLHNRKVRDLALLTLLVDVGPRAHECVNLTWPDIMPGFVTLRGKTGEREVPISDITYRRLELLMNGSGTGQVFLGERGPLTYSGLYKLIRKMCRRAGISGKRCSPHSFRHSFATHYASSDRCEPKMLQSILGHKDFRTTLRYIEDNKSRKAQNHPLCTPLRLIPGAAQATLFDYEYTDELLQEAENIIKKKN